MKPSLIKKALVVLAAVFVLAMPADAKKGTPKYVFYLIGDGMGINEVYGANIYDQYKGGEGVNFLNFPIRTFVTTHSASTLVTDSAAAGTALATGVKTTNDFMGVDPQDNPLRNLTERAHAAGFGAGVATSVGVNHATPAAFYAHTHARGSYNTIAEQLIAAENVDFAAGAGFLTESKKGVPQQYFKDKAKEAGISVLHGKAEFNNIGARKGRVFCFSGRPTDTELVYAIDRQGGETELLDFTKAGIEYLYANFKKQGFFFMIEGGKIDYAGHNDDAACDIQEVLDYAKTVECILDFYNQHPDETLIVITADHETSGYMLSSGQYAMSPKYLSGQKYSENVISDKFRELTAPKGPVAPGQRPTRLPWDEVKKFLTENLGMWDVVPVSGRKEAELWSLYEGPTDGRVESLYSSNSAFISACIDYVDSMAGYLLPIGSHSGSPVGLYVKGVQAERFMECRDNTDIPKTIAAIAGYK